MPANLSSDPTMPVKIKPETSKPETIKAEKSKAEKSKAVKIKGEKVRLDKATVVNKAATLVAVDGWEGLTLHRLADELGVQTPSLYNHIDGLPGLQRELTLLNARNLTERMARAAMGKAGPAAVFAVMDTYRAYVKERPGLYLASVRVSANQSQPNPELAMVEEHAVEVMVATLGAFDLSREAAIHAVRGLRSLVHGFATLEVGGGFGYPVDRDASFRWLLTIFVRGLGEEKSAQAK